MANKQKNKNEKQKNLTTQGSGSDYHREHASNVAGYGDLDPNAEGLSNSIQKTDS